MQNELKKQIKWICRRQLQKERKTAESLEKYQLKERLINGFASADALA